jgi:uncharacterized membrane protein YgcG
MIKKIFLFLIVVFSLFIEPVCAQYYGNEHVLNFHSDIKVQPDSSMLVTETITVIAGGNKIKHGIYRDFPTRYKDRYGNKYVVDFEVIEVLKDGKPENYWIENMVNGKRIYIGKKDVLLPSGEYTYTISYKTNRQLGFFKDHDELYWNVTGNGWDFPIDKASATVELPSGASEKITGADAYTGLFGDFGKDFSTSRDNYGNVVFSTTRPLYEREGLTIVIGWAKGFVKEPTLQMKISYIFRDNLNLLFGLIGLVGVLLYYLWAWEKVGKDPAKGTIIPQYEPPEGLSPAAVRYITKMGFDNKAFTSAVVSMAQKRYLTINEKNKVYTLIKTGSTDLGLSSDEMLLAKKLFAFADGITIIQENHEKINMAKKALKKYFKKNYQSSYFFTNTKYFIAGLVFSFLILILSFTTRYSDFSLGRVDSSIFFASFIIIMIIVLIKNSLDYWKLFFSSPRRKVGNFFGAVYLIVISVVIFAVSFPIIGGYLSLVSFSDIILTSAFVVINLIFYYLLKAPTKRGRKIMDEIEGFKWFLSVTEKDRMNFFNPPEKTPELFERFLAYAIALDVENKWAEQFSEVFKKLAESGAGIYSPTWYCGHSWSYLNPGSFASGLGSSFSSAISSASVVPGSRSGFGGGGGSGGGGGGGGGGGW